MESGTSILVAEKYDAHEGSQLGTSNVYALEVNIAACGSRISVIIVCRSLASDQAENVERFHFLSVIVRSLGYYNAPGTGWICEAARKTLLASTRARAHEEDTSTGYP